jgi:hypothetical protein
VGPTKQDKATPGLGGGKSGARDLDTLIEQMRVDYETRAHETRRRRTLLRLGSLLT